MVALVPAELRKVVLIVRLQHVAEIRDLLASVEMEDLKSSAEIAPTDR